MGLTQNSLQYFYPLAAIKRPERAGPAGQNRVPATLRRPGEIAPAHPEAAQQGRKRPPPGPRRLARAQPGVSRRHPLRAAGGRYLQAPTNERHRLLELPAPLPAPGPAAARAASRHAGHPLALRRALPPPPEPARRIRLLRPAPAGRSPV